jgi:hypothetical protein
MIVCSPEDKTSDREKTTTAHVKMPADASNAAECRCGDVRGQDCVAGGGDDLLGKPDDLAEKTR